MLCCLKNLSDSARRDLEEVPDTRCPFPSPYFQGKVPLAFFCFSRFITKDSLASLMRAKAQGNALKNTMDWGERWELGDSSLVSYEI